MNDDAIPNATGGSSTTEKLREASSTCYGRYSCEIATSTFQAGDIMWLTSNTGSCPTRINYQGTTWKYKDQCSC